MIYCPSGDDVFYSLGDNTMNISISNIVILLIVIGGPVWFVMRYINMDRERKLRKKDYQEYVDSFVPELEEIDVKASYPDRAVLGIGSEYRLVSHKLNEMYSYIFA